MDGESFAGGRIRARRIGAGKPVVLLHSLLADASSWEGLAARLGRRFEVIIVDLPGFSGLPAVTGGLAPLAAILSDAIAAFGLDEAPLVVGNGFGSFLSLRLALDHPRQVRALALIGCGMRFSDQGRAAFRTMRETVAAKGLEAIADTAMARLFGAAFRAAHPELMAERRAAFLRTDPGMVAAACSMLEKLDLGPELHRVATPALLMAGSEDQATPPAMAEALAAQLPQARLHILDGLAHVPQLQNPARIEALLAL